MPDDTTDARAVLYATAQRVEADVFSSAAVSENVCLAAMQAYAATARRETREECARAADAVADDPTLEGRERHGARLVAAAIRQLGFSGEEAK